MAPEPQDAGAPITVCQPACEGGLCDCDEPDEAPKVCLSSECDC